MKRLPKLAVVGLATFLFLLSYVFIQTQLSSARAARQYEPIASNAGSADQLPAQDEASIKTLTSLNAKGERYGSGLFVDEGFLDLIQVQATNGKTGYARYADLNPPKPKTLDEAKSYKTEPQAIPVFESDGETLIGEFIINLDQR